MFEFFMRVQIRLERTVPLPVDCYFLAVDCAG